MDISIAFMCNVYPFLAFIYSLGYKSLHLMLESQVNGEVILVPHSGTVQLKLANSLVFCYNTY